MAVKVIHFLHLVLSSYPDYSISWYIIAWLQHILIHHILVTAYPDENLNEDGTNYSGFVQSKKQKFKTSITIIIKCIIMCPWNVTMLEALQAFCIAACDLIQKREVSRRESSRRGCVISWQSLKQNGYNIMFSLTQFQKIYWHGYRFVGILISQMPWSESISNWLQIFLRSY